MDEILYFSSSCLFLNRSTPRFYSHSIGHTPSCTSSLSGRRHAGQVRIRSDSAASLTALEDAFLKIGLPSWKKTRTAFFSGMATRRHSSKNTAAGTPLLRLAILIHPSFPPRAE